MLVGQSHLQQLLKTPFESFPHSLLLVGERGCGKHHFAQAFAEHYGCDLCDITAQLTYEFLTEVSLNPTPTFYLVDLGSITEKEQNLLLKSVEEPSSGSYFILLTEALTQVLDTIPNRCCVMEFLPYSNKELQQFLTQEQNPQLLHYFRTPGKLLDSQKLDLDALVGLCDLLLSKLKSVNYANLLTVVSKINLKDEYDKYDLSMFLGVLSHQARTKYLETKQPLYLQCYQICQKETKKLVDKRINKQYFLYNLLTTLWEAAQC